MASLSMPLAKYERGGVPTDPLWHVKTRTSEPGPGYYDCYPFLTPATHRTTKAMYYPDRALQYPGGNLYAQQPMWLSLPVKERNRFWVNHRSELDRVKKNKVEKHFLTFQDETSQGPMIKNSTTSGEKKTGNALNRTVVTVKNNAVSDKILKSLIRDDLKFTMGKSIEDLVYNNRDLPMTVYARCPTNLGNHPLLKRVASEPTFPQYDTNTSSLPFADRRELQRSFRVTKGTHKLHRKILETRKSLNAIATLAKDNQKDANKSTTITNETPGWYIPPLPREDGLGEMLANKSIKHYKVVARERAIEPNAVNQKDCIGNRWTGIGNGLPTMEPMEG